MIVNDILEIIIILKCLVSHSEEYFSKLLACKIGELYKIWHSAAKSGVAFHQMFHIIRLSRHYHNKIVPVVFHFRYQGVNSFSSVGPCILVAPGVQSIRLVYEEHRAIRITADSCCFRGSMSDILAAQVFAAIEPIRRRPRRPGAERD